MTKITLDTIRILKLIRKREFIPENELPQNINRRRLQYLIELGLVIKFTLVPPGEEGYARGLYGYTLSPKGEDAIYIFHKVEVESRIALCLAIASLILSLTVAFTPVDEWITNFFTEIAVQESNTRQPQQIEQMQRSTKSTADTDISLQAKS